MNASNLAISFFSCLFFLLLFFFFFFFFSFSLYRFTRFTYFFLSKAIYFKTIYTLWFNLNNENTTKEKKGNIILHCASTSRNKIYIYIYMYYRVIEFVCTSLSKRSVQISSSFLTKRFGAYVASRCHRIILEIDGSPSLKYMRVTIQRRLLPIIWYIYIYMYIYKRNI